MIDYYVRYVKLPWSVRGVTVPNGDTTFDIYINSRLPEEMQRSVLEHELRHIKQEHFYVDLPIETIEAQANGLPIASILHPPEGMIACFTSEAAMSHWFNTVLTQLHIKL